MKATLLKRLFRIIYGGSKQDLVKFSDLIIEDAEKKGHTQLAKELRKISEIKSQANILEEESEKKGLTELPNSSRNNKPLGVHIPVEKLQNYMILPNVVENRFNRIEREYAARDRLATYGLLPRKKILLYGPPGCGKTLGAQRLAYNTGLPLIKLSFDSIVSSYFGETSSNLRSIFESASTAPCLLFIDECDSIAINRISNNEVGEVKRIVNSFLQLLDEYDSPGLLVAATNLSDQLDPAIWRRFDDIFEIPKPGEREILLLLKTKLLNFNTKGIVWEDIVQSAIGLSAAQVLKVANNAAKIAVLEANDLISQESLKGAIDEIFGGKR